MPNVLLGVTGSVAATKTPLLYAALRDAGYRVKIVATPAALYFFDPAAIEPLPADPPHAIPKLSYSMKTNGPVAPTANATNERMPSCTLN